MTMAEVVKMLRGLFVKLFPTQPIIRPKSPWQAEAFCKNHLYGIPGCKKVATHEAFYQKGKVTAAILCCANPECQEKARETAKKTIEKMTQS